MRWLIPVGLVLMLAGGAGAIAAYVQSAQPGAGESTSANGTSDGGVPADEANRSNAGPLILAPLAGLALASASVAWASAWAAGRTRCRRTCVPPIRGTNSPRTRADRPWGSSRHAG